MILFTTLFIIAFVIYKSKKRIKSFFYISIVSFLVFIFFLFEYAQGDVSYLISDGYRYFFRPEDWIIDIDRALWGFVNYFEKYYDIGGAFFIKILNIPILLIFLIQLERTFKFIKEPYVYILVYPYLLFLSISNLRDILIWLFAILIFQQFYKKTVKSYFAAIIFGIGLYMLRPFMFATAFIAIIAVESFSLFSISKKISSRQKLFKLSLILFLGLSILSIYPLITDKVDSYFYNARYMLTEGFSERAIERKADEIIDVTNIPKSIIIGHIRYILTPVPTSLLKRLISNEFDFLNYGIVGEILRLINQINYYLIMILVLINFKSVIKTIQYFSREQKGFLLWLLAFLPIYAVAHFGGSHQRLKLPFQIFLFIIYVYATKIKKETNKNNSN